MELKILEEKKGKMVFELIGSTHTLCNMLKTELWSSKGIKSASYVIRHPLVGHPEFIVESDKKDFEKLSETFRKEVR